jgi:regulator of protease activity HflC (stomatin/prohibitin superfamily)
MASLASIVRGPACAPGHDALANVLGFDALTGIPGLDPLTGIPGLIAGAVVLGLALRSLTTVADYQRYVLDDGATVLEPGVHVRNPFSRGGTIVDLRTRAFESTFETVATSDRVQTDIEVALDYEVTEAAAAVRETHDYEIPRGANMEDHEVALIEALEVTLLDHARQRTWAALSADPDGFAADCEADLAPVLDRFGVALENVDVVAVERTRDEGVHVRDDDG